MSQYFENNTNLKNNPKKIDVFFKNKKYTFSTNNGLFSKKKIDYGSNLLLTNFLKEKKDGKILDLGCGYGAIGIIIAKTLPSSNVDMIDITDLAIKISKENIGLNNLSNIKVFKSNIYENIKDKYNYIITNPPIRAGKEIILNFLLNSKDYLKDNGELWFVMRKNHGVKTIIKCMENKYDIQVIDKSNGFYIVCAKPKVYTNS